MQKKILYIKPLDKISFIDNDGLLLEKHFDCQVLLLHTKGVFNNLKSHFSIVYHLLFKQSSFDIIYIWFADYYTLFPALSTKFSQKKCFIVIGGYDSAKVPAINYGAHLNPLRSLAIKYSCKWCTHLLPVTKNAEENLFKNIGLDLSHKSSIVYNLIDTEFFKADKSVKKTSKVVYLANVDNETSWKRKNINFIIEIAESMPHISFELIGLKGEFHSRIEATGLKNISSVGHLNKENFRSILAEASVICLFSKFESFGISVGEGILMGCIPLSMKNLGTAELIQDERFLLNNYEVLEASHKIEFALKADSEAITHFINHVKTNFSPERREKELRRILS